MERWQLNSMELDVILFLGNNPGCDTASDITMQRMLELIARNAVAED